MVAATSDVERQADELKQSPYLTAPGKDSINIPKRLVSGNVLVTSATLCATVSVVSGATTDSLRNFWDEGWAFAEICMAGISMTQKRFRFAGVTISSREDRDEQEFHTDGT